MSGTDSSSPPSPEDGRDRGALRYGIDDSPPPGESVALGVQHYLTMVGATVAIPLAIAGAVGMPDWATARLVLTFFVVSGISTLLQTTVGNRYPIVQGGTFSMLAPALAIVAVLSTQDAGWQVMIRELQGAVIVAGAVEILIGVTGLMGRLKKYVGPNVVAPVIILIGLSLAGVPQITNPNFGAPGTGQNWYLLGGTALLIIAFSKYLDRAHRTFDLYPVVLGVGVAWGATAVLSVVGVVPEGSVSYVSLSGLAENGLVQPIVPFQWGLPLFTPGFFAGMIAGMLASVVESYGDYHSVAQLAGEDAPNRERINWGIGMEGVGNVIAGVFGTGNGSTSYTENVGAIGITGVASRRVVQVGAVVMLVAGFLAPLGQLVATIPAPIVGGLYVAMFAEIVAAGLGQLDHVDLSDSRNLYVVGLALFAGLAVPQYVATVGQGMEAGGAAALARGLSGVPVLGAVLGIEAVARTVFVVGQTNMAVGGLVALVLDSTMRGSAESRGLAAFREATEPPEAFRSVLDLLRDRRGPGASVGVDPPGDD